MAQSWSKIGSYNCLVILAAIFTTACSAPKQIVAQIPSSPPIAVSTPPPEITPAPVVRNDGELYEQALTKADAARAIGQSAASKDDWFLVAHSLQDSVTILKSISPTSSQYILAAKVLPAYEQQLAAARQKAASFVSKSPQNLATSNQVASLPTPDTFTIPILQKLGGVPVIEVSFNDTKVPMLLDTGASNTLVTSAIADRLQLQAKGTSQAKTANGTATFQVATIDKVQFGNGEIKNVRVAIGQNDLPYGLLGHDVYDGYDITIKESSIEFKKR